jgi:hypothetical protein
MAMNAKRIPGAYLEGALHLRFGLACLLLLAAVPVLAQSGGVYDLTWSTIDGGGWTFSEGGGYSVGGTAGQPDAGLLIGDNYTLAGGFWPGGAVAMPRQVVYLPVVMLGY